MIIKIVRDFQQFFFKFKFAFPAKKFLRSCGTKCQQLIYQKRLKFNELNMAESHSEEAKSVLEKLCTFYINCLLEYVAPEVVKEYPGK